MQMTGSDLPSLRPYPWAMSTGCQSERTFHPPPVQTPPDQQVSDSSSKLRWLLWIISLQNGLYLGFIVQVGLGKRNRSEGFACQNAPLFCAALSPRKCLLDYFKWSENVCLRSQSCYLLWLQFNKAPFKSKKERLVQEQKDVMNRKHERSSLSMKK